MGAPISRHFWAAASESPSAPTTAIQAESKSHGFVANPAKGIVIDPKLKFSFRRDPVYPHSSKRGFNANALWSADGMAGVSS
jgi:hypothetical protein